MSHYRDNQKVICALSTPSGLGGVGLIRVSGTGTIAVTRRLAAFLPDQLQTHNIYYGHLKSNDGLEVLDEVLISYFRTGKSFTGEETCEISFHGNPGIADRILKELVFAGARPAEPGEFTFRAFLSGRIDLTQAEAVLSLIESRSQKSQELSLRQLQGSLKQKLELIESDLTQALTHLEANLDFAQEDIEVFPPAEVLGLIKKSERNVQELLSGYRSGQVARSGFRVAILGQPNVGKSSLLNALVGQEKAIVTEIPGTTRDVVSAEMFLDGYAVTFMDTAGLRATEDIVEKIGIDRSHQAARESDLIIFMDDIESPDKPAATFSGRDSICVRNKADLLPGPIDCESPIYVSAKSGLGLEKILSQIKTRLKSLDMESGEVILQARQADLLNTAGKSLVNGIQLYSEGASPEFVISDIQCALESVMEIQGKKFDDEVMDQVFKQFCLGK